MSSSRSTEPATTNDEPAKRRVAKHYTPSQRAEAVEYARKHGVTKASKELGPSRYSLYAWIREAEAAAEGKATTKAEPSQTENQRDAEILDR